MNKCNSDSKSYLGRGYLITSNENDNNPLIDRWV